ncbi:MAG: hypothetical protein V1889_02445 [archaeon]
MGRGIETGRGIGNGEGILERGGELGTGRGFWNGEGILENLRFSDLRRLRRSARGADWGWGIKL